jgi:putative PEP-CTERM system histidine kinase
MLSACTATLFIYILFAFRILKKERPFSGHRLLIALVIWSAGYSTIIFIAPKMLEYGIFVDAIKHILILFFMLFLVDKENDNLKIIKPIIFIIFGVMMLSFLSPVIGLNSFTVFAFAGVFATLLQLLLSERLYQISQINGNSYHILVAIIGILSLIDFSLYCEIIITSTLGVHQIQWKSLGILMCTPFLWKGLNSLQKFPVMLSISKPLAFQGALFFLSGMYLLAVSVLGYFLQTFNLGFNYTTQLVIGGAAVLPLTLMLSSQRMRKEVLVWINKHLFAAQFDYRTTWLTLIEKLDPNLLGHQAYQQGLKTVLNAINHTSGVYYSVSVTNNVKCMANIETSLNSDVENTLSNLIDYLTASNWVIDIPDFIENKHHYPNLVVNIDNLLSSNIRWIVPIISEDILKGILIVGKTNHKDWELNWETRDFLFSLGHQLERYFFSQETVKKLSEHAQLTAFHQTSAFVVHDLKNVYAQMKMLIENSEKHRDNPEFINDVFLTMESMKNRVEKTLNQLTKKQNNKVETTSKTINIVNFIEKILNNKDMLAIDPPVTMTSDVESTHACVCIDSDRFSNVIRHLIDNARYACKKIAEPEIFIKCESDENHVIISVIDNGVGMSKEFIEGKLFQPFETTKGNAGMGLGVYDAKVFSENHNGYISASSELGSGSQFKISLPRSGQYEVVDR